MFSNITKEKIFFTQHLFLMLKGGFLISEALETLREEVKSKALKKALEDVLKRVLSGESLNKSLARHPKIFDQFYQSIIKIGEESGNLENNLKYLASQIRSDYEIKRRIRGAMLYPAMVIILAIIIALVVTIFILPKIIGLFSILEIQLPLITRFLIKSVSFFQKNWIFIILGIILIIFLFKILRKLKSFRYYSDKLIISLPIAGLILRNLTISRFSQSFYTLLKSGLPILESLELCSQTTPNEVFKRNLVSVKLEVEKGGKISQGLRAFPETFPLIFSQMVSVGEKSGTLEDSCHYLAKFYQREVNMSLKTLSTVLEPILLIFVGVFVAFVALAIITPIYRFSSALKFR